MLGPHRQMMATNAESDVVRLGEPQVQEAGEVLGRAFFADPLARYMLPDEEARARLLPWHYSTLVRYGYLHGEVYTTAGRVDGAAVCLPPTAGEMTLDRLEQAGMLDAPRVLGQEAFGRLVGVVGYLEGLRKRDAPPGHWYLLVLGVDPPQQGKGLGSTIARPFLTRADAEGRACYLETFEPRNLPFYQRLGFDLVVEDIEPGSHLRFWTFRRDPQR